VVPSSATVYVQVVGSQLAQKWNRLQPVFDVDGSTVLLDTPVKIQQCPGAAAVHDIQLSQFPRDQFCTIIPPTPVFRYHGHKFIHERRLKWTGKYCISSYNSHIFIFHCEIKEK
jgi:protein arginine N-methyltransferase 7